MTDRAIVGLAPAVVAAGASLVCTGLVVACGLGGLFAMAVALNGFSESEAVPFFVGFILLLLLANLGLTTISSVAVLRLMDALGARLARLLVAGIAVGCTLTPVACVAGFFLLGGSL